VTRPVPKIVRCPRMRGAGSVLVVWLSGGAAFAQAPPAVAVPAAGEGAPPPAPSPAGGVAPSPAPAGVVPVGPVLIGRLGEGQATIVGGNVASARERALTEAFKRAVDAAIDALGSGGPDGDVRTAQPKVVVQILGRARGFVRRYRTLDEGERPPGTYAVRIDAEVDDAAVRRTFERAAAQQGASGRGAPGAAGPAGSAGANAPAGQPGSPPPAYLPSYLVVGSGGAALEAAGAVAKALAATGARVRPGTAADSELPERALQAAAQAQLGAVAFVVGTTSSEGRVRGPGLESVSCSLELRVVQAGSGVPVADETETTRSFSEHEETARSDCLGRAAGAVVARVAPQGSDARAGSGLRTVTVDADVVEPGAVLALLKQLRGLGPVSGVDLRSIVGGHVELQVRSRLPGAALVALVARDASVLDWTGAEVTGDLVRARVRLRSNEVERVAPLEAPVQGGGEPGAPAASPGAAAPARPGGAAVIAAPGGGPPAP